MLQASSKILSLCLIGRNDNYGGPFLRRLRMCVNFFARSARALNRLDDVEVVIADWNSIQPLAEVLELSSDSAAMCKIVRVPPDIAVALNHPGTQFHTTRALNVACRRAQGEYIAFTPADVLFTAPALANLLGVVEGRWTLPFDPTKALLMASRRLIPTGTPDERMSEADLDRFLMNSHLLLASEAPLHYIGGACGSLIHHRSLLEAFEGYDEELGGWGWSDLEFGLRIGARCPLVELSYYGVTVYDFKPTRQNSKVKDQRFNRCEHLPYSRRQPEWGLANLDLSVMTARGHANDLTISAAETHPDPPRRLGEILEDAKIRNVVRPYGHPMMERIEPHHLLASYLATRHGCTQYLEFGEDGDHFSAMMARLVPTAEINFVVPEHPIIPESNSVTFAHLLPLMLQRAPLQNIFRPMVGDPASAVERLSGILGGATFDIVMIHARDTAETFRRLSPAIDRLSRNGFVIAKATKAQALAELIEIIEDKTTMRLAFRSARHNCAAFIPPTHTNYIPDDGHWPAAERNLRSIRRKPLHFVAWKLFRTLSLNFNDAGFTRWARWPREVLKFDLLELKSYIRARISLRAAKMELADRGDYRKSTRK